MKVSNSVLPRNYQLLELPLINHNVGNSEVFDRNFHFLIVSYRNYRCFLAAHRHLLVANFSCYGPSDDSRQALNHILANTLTHTLTYTLIHTLNHTVAHTLTHSINHTLIHTLNNTVAHTLTHAINHTLIHTLTHILKYTPTHTLAHTRVLIRCFC